jgi:hypothetical protein
MGSITRGLSNNITTGGVILPAGITNASVSAVTSFANAASAGTLTLLSTQTASASATISFTTGLDSTYDEYIFKFIDIHPSVQNAFFTFNFSTDSGSNYNVTKTSTAFRAYHFETDLSEILEYLVNQDLAQSTSFQPLIYSGNDNDMSVCGELKIFNPSSTTYVKHYISVSNGYTDGGGADLSENFYIAGYGNTTSAVNAIQFKMSSGNIDDGVIKLYGVKKS